MVKNVVFLDTLLVAESVREGVVGTGSFVTTGLESDDPLPCVNH